MRGSLLRTILSTFSPKETLDEIISLGNSTIEIYDCVYCKKIKYNGKTIAAIGNIRGVEKYEDYIKITGELVDYFTQPNEVYTPREIIE